VFNLADFKLMRSLDPTDIDTLVSVKGMVTRTSTVIPDLRTAYYRCTACGTGTEVGNDRGRVDEPASCPHCGAKKRLELVHNRCAFMDKQYVKLVLRALRCVLPLFPPTLPRPDHEPQRPLPRRALHEPRSTMLPRRVASIHHPAGSSCCCSSVLPQLLRLQTWPCA